MAIDNKMLVIAQRSDVQIGVASAVSLGAGVAIGYFVAKKRLGKAFDEALEKEVLLARKYYERAAKPDLESLVEAIESEEPSVSRSVLEAELDKKEGRAIVNYGGGASPFSGADEDKPALSKVVAELGYAGDTAVETEEELAETQASIRRGRDNIFEHNEGRVPQPEDVAEQELEDFDFDLQADLREQGKPYIITSEQFFEGAPEYENRTLTFYEDGGTLMEDDSNSEIHKIDEVIGLQNLHFGRGSRDHNIVYIRNDKLEKDFEVLRSWGSYASVVLGFKHSDDPAKPGVRKFRNYD